MPRFRPEATTVPQAHPSKPNRGINIQSKTTLAIAPSVAAINIKYVFELVVTIGP